MSRSPLLLIGALAVTLALPPLTASAAIVLEDCDNCVDDDGDMIVDRNDPDCTTPANGGNVGIGDVTRGKAVAKCGKTIQKAGTKFVLGVMKQMQKCTQASATCIQLKPGDAACQAKAVATCDKLGGAIRASINKLEDTIEKCDPDGTVNPDLVALQGLGFSAEDCNSGTTGLIAGNCVVDQHLCNAQHLVGIATPRARELMIFGGLDPDSDFPCLSDYPEQVVDGGNSSVDPTHAKALLKCGKTIDKLSLSLLGASAKTVQGCLDAGIACLQVKPTDPACVTKAQAKCAKSFGKLQDPAKGTIAKIAGKFLKVCSSGPNLSIIDLGGTSGLGLSALISRCNALGASGIDQCFGAQAFCEGGYIVERQIPRARELADLLGVVIPGF
jgi:hypothetical protein